MSENKQDKALLEACSLNINITVTDDIRFIKQDDRRPN